MNAWPGFQFHALTQVPQEPEPERDDAGRQRDNTVRALLTSLTASQSDLLASGDPGAALMTAWIKAPGDRQLRFVLGGRPFFPPALGAAADTTPNNERGVLFPPGARARDLPVPAVAAMLDEFPYWTVCSGWSDALWALDETGARPATRRGSFDGHAAHLHAPFAWLVLAQPLTSQQVRPEIEALVNEIIPLSRGEVSESKRIGLERRRARHRELSRLQHGGLWQIRVLAGGLDPRGSAAAAAMLCAAADLDDLPYTLRPAGRPRPLAHALNASPADLDGAPPSFPASTSLLVALTRPPTRELPGLRLVRPHSFDVTPEEHNAGGLVLGQVLDSSGSDVADLSLTRDQLNRHTFVCGATGAGKSHTVRHLLEQATRAGVPWLVIEPAKAEYARMADRIATLGGDVTVIRPGSVDLPPAGLNPLEPAPGFPLQTHVDLLRALFLASFEAQEPFPQILATALKRSYEELGWDLALGEPIHPTQKPRYPMLSDLQRVAETVVQEIGYGREVADNMRGFIKVRIASLRLGSIGRFFEGGHPLDFTQLRAHNVVLEIEDVGDDADKAFFMGVILMQLVEHLRVDRRAQTSSGVTHLTVVEEAHRLLRRPAPGSVGPAAHAVEMFAAMLAEVRAYGEGLIIAEQIPSKLIPDVIKNTAVKIVHRLPALDDRESVGATMNLDQDQSRYLVTLVPGQAAVFADGMDRPIAVRIPPSTESPSPGVAAAPISQLIGRRSTTCGVDCRTEACTLRQLRHAQHLLATQHWLTMWAELTVIAHLTGHPTPLPTPALLEAFGTQPRRLVDCALSQAVDDAVAVRSGALPTMIGPAALAEHICGTMRAMLGGHNRSCDDDDKRYVCAPYQWTMIRHALATDTPGDPGPHPRTDEWERRYGRKIPGRTRAAQLTCLAAWPDADIGDQTRRDNVIHGARRPSTVEEVIGAPAPGWPDRLTAVLEQFLDCSWAHLHLDPPPDSTSD